MGGMSEIPGGGSLGGRIRRRTACSVLVVGGEVRAGRADPRCLWAWPPLHRREYAFGCLSEFLAECWDSGSHGTKERRGLPAIADAANHGNVMLERSSHQKGRLLQVLGLDCGRINCLAVDPSFGTVRLGSVGDIACERPRSLNNNEPASLAFDCLVDDAFEI